MKVQRRSIETYLNIPLMFTMIQYFNESSTIIHSNIKIQLIIDKIIWCNLINVLQNFFENDSSAWVWVMVSSISSCAP